MKMRLLLFALIAISAAGSCQKLVLGGNVHLVSGAPAPVPGSDTIYALILGSQSNTAGRGLTGEFASHLQGLIEVRTRKAYIKNYMISG